MDYTPENTRAYTAKERVEIELADLEEKLPKLQGALRSPRFAGDELLKQQESIMVSYVSVLKARLATWKD